MTEMRISDYPVKHHGPFDPDEVDRNKLQELFGNYPVLNHFVWSSNRDTAEGVLVRAALMMAESAGSYNTDTNLALRKLLEARALHRMTRDRILIDNPHAKRRR